MRPSPNIVFRSKRIPEDHPMLQSSGDSTPEASTSNPPRQPRMRWEEHIRKLQDGQVIYHDGTTGEPTRFVNIPVVKPPVYRISKPRKPDAPCEKCKCCKHYRKLLSTMNMTVVEPEDELQGEVDIEQVEEAVILEDSDQAPELDPQRGSRMGQPRKPPMKIKKSSQILLNIDNQLLKDAYHSVSTVSVLSPNSCLSNDRYLRRNPSDSGQSIEEIPVELLEIQRVSSKNNPEKRGPGRPRKRPISNSEDFSNMIEIDDEPALKRMTRTTKIDNDDISMKGG
ncbi:hypothetical protein WR25_21682 [Diploscapter pachys]|uniref:Uncharacterized protein n=1 Tax=Diploscapter pachys TaxID=2018661 RepID=A0A2A2LC39_9BILA|nr:hypothetical protein WR25_21682 [Diploscapter pachys]